MRIVSHSEDWGRRYLAGNGGCAYIDLDHLELCLPETTNAYDFLACWQAMLRIASAAQQKASQRLPDGQSLHVLLNNSDAQSHSYGSHLNVLLSGMPGIDSSSRDSTIYSSSRRFRLRASFSRDKAKSEARTARLPPGIS